MPVYRHNGDVYDIPQDKAREFESQFPDATVEVYSGNDVYDIPVGVQDEFFSRYSDASYSAPSAPSAEEVAEEMQPKDETRFGILGKMGQYMGSPSAYVPMPQAEEREELTQAEIDQRAAMRQMLKDSGTIDRMEEMEKEARKNKFKAFGEALAYTPQVSSFGVASNIYDSTEEQLADAQRALEASAEHRQNKAMEQTLDVALDKARAGEWGGIGENNVGNGVVDFGLGLWDSATRMSTWDFGVSDTLNGLTIAQVVKKWEEDPESLTATERNLLDAMGMATAVQEAYQDQVGIGYAVGESLPVSAGFMASMYLNPASGLGKSLARQAVKKYGRQSIAKNLARIGGDIAETAIMTATTGGGRVVADALDRINGQSTYDIDPETGIVMYGGQEDQKTVGEAVVKAIGSNFIENYSEALGEYFDPLLGMSRRVAAGGLRKMNLDKWADALSDVEPSQMAASIRSLREKAKFGGVFGEIMEEEVGMALNAITVGDYTFSKEEADASNGKKQWIFDLENQLTTALSCAIMSGAMTGVETIGNVRYRRDMERSVADAEKAARAAVGDEMIAQIDQASPEGMVDILRDAYMDQNLTLQQKRTLAEYATQRVRMQYYNAADAKARRQVNETQQNTIDAYEAGRHAQLPQYYNIDQEYRKSEAAINERENAEEIWDAIRLMNNMDENERQNIMRDFSEEDQQLIRNWRYNEYRWRGAVNHRAEQVEDLVGEYAGQVNPYTRPDGTVTTAILGDNVVYVMNEAENGDAVVYTNDGRKMFCKMRDLEHVQQHNAEELIERFRQQTTEVVNQETEKNLNYPSEVFEPAVNVEVQTADGKTWLVTAVNGDDVQVSEMVLDRKSNTWNPNGAPKNMTRTEFMDWQKAELDRKKANTYEQGDELIFYVNGEPISAEITGIDPEGNYMVQISHLADGLDKAVSDVYTAEELRKLTTPSSKVSEKTTENESAPSEEINQSASEEVTNSQIEENVTEPTAEVAESVNTALSRVPKDTKGNPLYEQTDADTAWDAIMEQTEGDAEMAQRIAEEMVADKKAALTKMQKGKPKKGATVAEKIANEKAHIAAIAQAEQEVAAWEKIAQTEARRREAAMSEADRYADEMEQKNISEGLSALGEPQSLQEYVLAQLAGGAYKLRWNDKENDTKGFGSHTGLSTEEMKARLSMVDNKNGLTPEEIAHSIVENMDASFGEVDVMDVTDMVIDAVSTYASRRAMLNGMVESRAELLRQQEIAEQEAKDAWYMEQYHATEEELAAYNEYLAEFAEEIYGEDSDYEQRIITFAEQQLGYDNQGTDAGLRSSADQGEGLASDREGGRSVGETEQLNQREVLGDAAGVAASEDQGIGSSVSAQSDVENKPTANVFEMEEEAQKKRKSKKNSNDKLAEKNHQQKENRSETRGVGNRPQLQDASSYESFVERVGEYLQRSYQGTELSEEVAQIIRDFNKGKTIIARTEQEKALLKMLRVMTDKDVDWLLSELKTKRDALADEERNAYDDAVTLVSRYRGRGEHNAVVRALTGANLREKLPLTKIDELFDKYNSDADVAELYRRVRTIAEQIGLDFWFDDNMVDVQAGGFRGADNRVRFNAHMLYSPFVSDQTKASVMVHEILHAVADYAIETQETIKLGLTPKVKLSKQVLNAANTILNIYEKAVKGNPLLVHEEYDYATGQMRVVPDYGTTSTREMLMEISKPEFRDKLKQIEYNGRSVWQRIWDTLKSMFTQSSDVTNPTAYDSMARALDVLINEFSVDAYQKYSGLEESAARVSRGGDERTLAGLHNISEDKLKKAIKQGGLANPSMAVIDLETQGHTNFGDITLVAPSSLIDKKSGRNAGTYLADAWTPTYPAVKLRLDDKGWKKVKEYVDSVTDEPKLRADMRYGVEQYLNGYGAGYSNMQYAFLKEGGVEIPIARKRNDGYISDKEFKALVGMGAQEASNGSMEAYKKFKELPQDVQNEVYIWAINHGNKAAIDKVKERIKSDERYAKLYEGEVSFSQFNSLAYDTFRRERDNGEIDVNKTFREASDYVALNGLAEQFDKWLSSKLEEAGAKEMLFAGFDNMGNAKYVPNTLENASKLMKKEGKVNAYNDTGHGSTRAVLAEKVGTLEKIRRNKGKLQDEEAVKEAYEAFKDMHWAIIDKVHDQIRKSGNEFMDVDNAAKIVNYALASKNPVRELENDGYVVDEELGEMISDFVKYNKQMPVPYFETKFERPVMLDEFYAAVIPSDTDADIVRALESVGLIIETYERGNEESRKEAVDRMSDENVRFRDGAPFFSNAERAVENIKQQKATPEQWLAMIKKDGGLKAGEDKWMGLSDWLNEQKENGVKSLTRDEVLAFIRENQIEIAESWYGEGLGKIGQQRMDELNDEFRERVERVKNEWEAANSELEAFDKEMHEKYGDGFYYMLDESEQERQSELENAVSRDEPQQEAFDEMLSEYGELFEMAFEFRADRLVPTSDYIDGTLTEEAKEFLGADNQIDRTRIEYTTEGLDNKQEIALVVPTIESWNQSDIVHFGDAGDGRAVAWVRFGETTDEDGNRVLVIDEVQSKRHDEGRAKGYSREVGKEIEQKKAEYEQRREDLIILSEEREERRVQGLDNTDVNEQLNATMRRMNVLQSDLAQLRKEFYDKVPDAPFDKNYHELAMKRMLRYAAENGFDKVAWNTGKQVAERFGVSRSVEKIQKYDENTYKVYLSNGSPYMTLEFDDDGIYRDEYDPDLDGKSMSDIFGKQLSSKLQAMKEGEMLEEEGLSIGGEDRNALYDEMIPRFMNKYTKKWGAKVGEVTLPEVEEAGRTMWSVDVTPEMRESVMQGQPMFREGMGAISDREVSYENDPIAKWQGKPRYYGKRASAFAERERARMQKGVEEAAKILGIEVEVITDASTLKGRKAKAKGWYDINSKKVVVVVPNHVSKGDAVRTVLHEGVAHHGLRELFGDGFDAMLDNIYNNVAPELKARIDAIAERTGVSTSVATEEYLASLSEETNFEEAKNMGWWSKIKQFFVDMLRKLSMPGLNLKEEITDNELRFLLWRSYQNLVDPNSYLKPLGYLDDVAKQKELKVGNYAENTMATPRAAEGKVDEPSDIKPVGKGKFGYIYDQFKGKAKEAIAFLLKVKGGEAIGALHHPEIGDIDLVWGKEGSGKSDGYGLAKLAKYHGEVLDNLQEIIDEMHVTMRTSNRVQLESDTHQAAVRLTWDNEKKNWLLTAFEKKNSVFDNTTDTGETLSGKQNDTATLQNTILSDKVSDYSPTMQENEENILYRLVDDPAEIERLESEPTIKAYRAMQVIDGELYPPMSAVVEGKLREPIALGQWEQSDERPDLADDNGRFKLDKGNKKSLKAAYNPYFHSSSTPLNDQFSEAQDRDNLVTVEVEVPVSEADGTSGYKAEKAKDAVGTHQWKAGIIQGQLTGTREVFLTRWDKPVRIVPESEVADVIVEMFDGKDIVMPSNVVTPQLRKELDARGITFVETDNQGKLVEGEHKGEHYSKVYGKKADNGLRYREDSVSLQHISNQKASTIADMISDCFYDDVTQSDRIAMVEYLQQSEDGREVIDRLYEHRGSGWARQAVNATMVRIALHDLINGREPSVQSMLTRGAEHKVVSYIRRMGAEGVWRYLEEKDFLSEAAKPLTNVNGSFLSCNPSAECAKYCYATKGHYTYAGSTVKSELVYWTVATDPNRAADRIYREYQALRESAQNKALRLFDKGDLDKAWLPVIEELNRRGIVTQIFSKRSEVLQSVDGSRNVVMLSIDHSNADLLSQYPTMPIAFVYRGKQDMSLLEQCKERFLQYGGVILPVKVGQKVLPKEELDALPSWTRPYQCPIDNGTKQIVNKENPERSWNCTKCDKNGGVGCFFKRTAKQLKDNYNESKRDGLVSRTDRDGERASARNEEGGTGRTSALHDTNRGLGESDIRGGILQTLRDGGIPDAYITPELVEALAGRIRGWNENGTRGRNIGGAESMGAQPSSDFGREGGKRDRLKRTSRIDRNSEEIISEVEREAAALGVPVRIVRSVDELPDEDTRKRAVDGQLKGYFDPRTGEVALYEPNTDNANDAKRTILHETVGHKGLRQLIGEERYDKAMVQLMYMLPSEVRDAVLRRAERHGWNAAIAMDEYLAEQAERDVQPTWWGKVNAKIRAILRNLGFNVRLTDADVTYLLWRSRKKLMGDTAFDMATNAILKQAARKSAEADAWNEQAFKDAEMRDFEKGAMQRLRNRIGDAQNEYDSAMKSMAFKQRESWQDSMRSLKVFMDIVSKESGKKIADWENAYMYENAMSSANLMEMQMFRHDVYGRLLKAINELMESGAKYEEVVDYMMAKHGLERNEKMARAEAEEKVERWKEKAVEEMQAKAADELEKQNQRNAVIEARAKSAYKVKKQRLKGQLERGTISEAQYDHYMQMAEQAYQNELATMKTTHPVDVIAEIEKINTKAEQKLNEYWADHRDYSGLTALTGKDGVAGAESAAMQMIADFEAKHNTDLLWNETRACTQTILNISHDAGILSDEVYGELWNQYEYYIPLRGFDETTAEEVYTYVGDNKSPYNAPIKTAKGRKSKADDPIATIATMAESAIVEANRNRLKQRFLYMVERHRTELASVSSVWVEKDPITGDCVARFANIPNDATPEEAAQAQKAFEERMEQLHEQDPDRYYKASEKPNIPYRVEKKANEHEHQVIVKRNGKDVVITINGDPRVAQAINGLTNAEAVEGFSKFAGKVNRFLSANFTTRNPAFVVSNFVRDGFYTNSMVWAKEGRAYAWKYNQNFAKATILLPSLVSKYKRYEKGDKSALDMSDPVERAFYEFMINGGETGYTVINSVEDYKGIVAGDLKTMQGGVVGNTKKAVQAVEEVLDTFGRWAEDTSRFAAFLTSREMGRSVTKSIWDAKEISVNFNKKGSGRKMTQHDKGLNSILGWMSQQGRNLYVFWNAGMQGLYNFGKAAKEHPGKMAALAGTYFGIGMAIAAIFGGHDDDDEDYWNLPEYVRRNNICFRVGDKFVTLPLPIELRAIYGMGELAMSWMAGKEDPKKVGMKVVQQMSQVMPIDMMAEGGGLMAFVPSWAKPIVEVGVNTDWTGMPIYRERTHWNEHDPQWMLAFKSTSPELVAASRAINEATNKNLPSGKENKYDSGWADIEYLNNPAAWEHIAEGYLGGLATTFNQTKKSVMAIWNEDLREVRNAPVVSRFLKDAGEKSEEYALREDYFNAKGVVDELRSQRGHFRKESIGPSLTEEQRKDVMESRIEMEKMVNATISQWNSLENARKKLEDMVKDNPDQEVTFDGKKGNAKDALDEVTRRMVKLTEGYQ